MEVQSITPILRMFDYAKAKEFYIDWLGFKIDWEHRFDENAPLYVQVSGYGTRLHLSEHHGDGTPGTHLHVTCTGVKEFHQMLINKNYKYGRPGLEETFYETWSVTLHDPFGNQLIFDEYKKTNK